jgi:hypothetical protein
MVDGKQNCKKINSLIIIVYKIYSKFPVWQPILKYGTLI